MAQVKEATKKEIKEFESMSMAEFRANTLAKTPFLIEGFFVEDGTSITFAKVGVAKSSFLRQLAYSVATGQPFLGKQVVHSGPVLYMYLEDSGPQTRSHFDALGVRDCDPIRILRAEDLADCVARLEKTIQENPHAVLIIIDPLFKFVTVRDNMNYSETNRALKFIHDMARKYGIHIAMATHATKKEYFENCLDNCLGSTAITGAVDDRIWLHKDSRGNRFIQTVLRDGEYNIPDTALTFDPKRKALSLGTSVADAKELDRENTKTKIKAAILRCVMDSPNGCTREMLHQAVEGKAKSINKYADELADCHTFTRTGEGTKTSPFWYTMNTLETQQVVAPVTSVASAVN